MSAITPRWARFHEREHLEIIAAEVIAVPSQQCQSSEGTQLAASTV